MGFKTKHVLFKGLYISKNKMTYLAFINLEKAFDKTNWNKMLFILQEIGVKQYVLKIIHSLQKNQTVCIKKANAQIKMKSDKGVPLSTLSPPLFNCYIKKIINKVKVKLAKVELILKSKLAEKLFQ